MLVQGCPTFSDQGPPVGQPCASHSNILYNLSIIFSPQM